MTYPSTFQFLILFGMAFEVLTVVRIRNVVELGHCIVWYIHDYECVGRSILILSTQAIMMDAVGPGQIVCVDHLNCMVP